MAKQKGIIKLEGTLGGITFLKTQDGYQAREKTSFDPSRIATEDKFILTRQNGQEFGRAGKAGRLLRKAFQQQIHFAKDNRIVSRLLKAMMRVIKTDITSTRGERNVLDGETELLQDFNCNIRSILSMIISFPYTATIDRVTGLAEINVPTFTPKIGIDAPAGATHCRLFTAAAEIDFEADKFTKEVNESALIPWNGTDFPAFTLSHQLPAASTHPLFMLLGIRFYQMVNGTAHPMQTADHNALSIVKVSGL